jgi:molybdopterin converting factor subunit 1
MKVSVLYFAQAKDILGRGRESLEVSPGTTAADLFEEVARGHPRLAALRPSVRISVNQEVVPSRHELKAGDVVALLPPVAGG